MSTLEPWTPEWLIAQFQTAQPDRGALFGLNQIDWSTITHAHGAAHDVPPLLRATLSSDPDKREFAFRLLHETIWHQGTIYQATSHVVPFLVKLILAPDVAHEVDYVILLASIARGNADFVQGFLDSSEEQMWRQIFQSDGRDLDHIIAENTRWQQATRQAVQEVLPVLYPYLSYPESEVRGYIARALACYPERAQSIIPLLEAHLQSEQDSDTYSEIVEALQQLRQAEAET